MDLASGAPVIVDPHDAALGLREHRPDDVTDIVAQCLDPLTRRWTDVPDPYERRHGEEFVRTRPAQWLAGRHLCLAVELEGRFAGTVGLRPVAGSGGVSAEVDFGLAPWARGRRIASRALRMVLAWAFDTLGLRIVRCRALVGNWRARRVAWAVGFAVHPAVTEVIIRNGRAEAAWLATLSADLPLVPRHPWFVPPELVGPSPESGLGAVLLRTHRPDDAQRIVEACNDPVSRHWLPQLPDPYTTDDAAAFQMSCREEHAGGRAVHWAVTRTGERRLMAQLALYVRGPEAAEIGYWTHPDSRRGGMMTAAVRLATRHALLPSQDGGLGLTRVLIQVARDNIASQRVALAAGFTPSGVDRAAERLRDGTLMDMRRFDLVAAECP